MSSKIRRWNELFTSTVLLLFIYLTNGEALLLESQECGLLKVISHSGAVFGPNPDEFPVLEKPLFLLTEEGNKLNDSLISIGKADENVCVQESNFEQVEQDLTEKYQALLVETRRLKDWAHVLRNWIFFGRDDQETLTSNEEGNDQSSTASVEPSLKFACEPLTLQGSAKGKILVVARGVCYFYEKTLYAEAAGAVGVIVVNGKREPPVRMRSPLQYDKPLKEPSIPTILISWEDFFQNIVPCYQNRSPIIASMDSRGSKSPVLDSNDALNWAMLKAMFFWIIFQFAVNIFRYRRQTRNLNKRANAVQSLPQYVYHEVNPSNSNLNRRLCIHMSHENILEGNQGICAVCLDLLIEDEVVRKFQCGHIFHKDCIDPWLLQSNLCPTCKRNVLGLPLATSSRLTLSEPEVDVRLED